MESGRVAKLPLASGVSAVDCGCVKQTCVGVDSGRCKKFLAVILVKVVNAVQFFVGVHSLVYLDVVDFMIFFLNTHPTSTRQIAQLNSNN